MFRDHAGKDGDKDHLSKKEAKELLKEEFPNILGDTSDPSMVDNILKDLDTNGDSKLDFQEFMILALTLAMSAFFFSHTERCSSSCSSRNHAVPATPAPAVLLHMPVLQTQPQSKEYSSLSPVTGLLVLSAMVPDFASVLAAQRSLNFL
ncbi:protein S100-Z [Lates japonicus]|uniref:Protein S100-Z n=1 Tax=Lates japonicus TaxID=270547 RepID=A0AAD3R235_LATJO|nr:protein S100-Z [Lates japonicus]